MTEIKATAGTTVTVPAGGGVTIRVRGPAVVRVGPPGPPLAGNGATMPGLAEAVSLLAARLHGVPGVGLSGDVPAGSVTAALTILAHALLRSLDLRDDGAALLRGLGEAAAGEPPP